MKRHLRVKLNNTASLIVEDAVDVDLLRRTLTVSQKVIRDTHRLLHPDPMDIVREGVRVHGLTPKPRAKRKRSGSKRPAKRKAKRTTTAKKPRKGCSKNGKRLGRPPKNKA